MSISLLWFPNSEPGSSANSFSMSGRNATAPSHVQSNSTAHPTARMKTVPVSVSERTATLRHRNRFHFTESRYSRRIASLALSRLPGLPSGKLSRTGKRACTKHCASSFSSFFSSWSSMVACPSSPIFFAHSECRQQFIHGGIVKVRKPLKRLDVPESVSSVMAEHDLKAAAVRPHRSRVPCLLLDEFRVRTAPKVQPLVIDFRLVREAHSLSLCQIALGKP